MEIKSILTAFLISLGWSTPKSDAQQIKTALSGESNLSNDIKIERNFRNLFDSIMERNKQKSKSHLSFLEEQTLRDQQTFKMLKRELQSAQRNRALYRQNNVIGGKSVSAFKRETQDNMFNKPLEIHVEGKKARKAQGKSPAQTRRTECYKMLTFSPQGVTMSSVIGLEDKDKLVAGGVQNEADTLFTNAQTVLDRNGSSLDSVYSVEIKLVNMNDKPIVEEIFKKHFHQPYPKKLYKQADGALPLNATVEAEISATMTMETLFKTNDDEGDSKN